MRTAWTGRRAFTIMELAFSVILLSIAAFYITDRLRAEAYQTSIVRMLERADKIIDSGIFDQQDGYLSGKNANCSYSTDYALLTAKRVEQCVNSGVDLFRAVGGGSWTDPKKWYFEPGVVAGQPCRFYVGPLGSDAYSLSLYFECSGSLNPVKSQYLEEFISSHFAHRYDTKYSGTSYLSTCVAEDGCGEGGTTSDRKVRIVLTN